MTAKEFLARCKRGYVADHPIRDSIMSRFYLLAHVMHAIRSEMAWGEPVNRSGLAKIEFAQLMAHPGLCVSHSIAFRHVVREIPLPTRLVQFHEGSRGLHTAVEANLSTDATNLWCFFDPTYRFCATSKTSLPMSARDLQETPSVPAAFDDHFSAGLMVRSTPFSRLFGSEIRYV